MKRARGFTIIELLTVVAIIAVLLTIVVSAAGGVMKSARLNRAQAMSRALEQGILAYYAQENKWPGAIETKGVNSREAEVSFTPSETDGIFQAVVGHGYGKSGTTRSILVDATALVVAPASKLRKGGEGCYDNHSDRSGKWSPYCGDQGCIGGMDFMTAANRNSKHHIGFENMAFGYQGPVNGKFCRYRVTYYPKTDTISVTYPQSK